MILVCTIYCTIFSLRYIYIYIYILTDSCNNSSWPANNTCCPPFVDIGFENGKFICYNRDNVYSDARYYAYMPDLNETCIDNTPLGDGSTVKQCLRDYGCSSGYNGRDYGCSSGYCGAISNITGKPRREASMMNQFDCTGRPWYTAAEKSSEGQAWSEIYVFVGGCAAQNVVLGITGSAVVRNIDGSYCTRVKLCRS